MGDSLQLGGERSGGYLRHHQSRLQAAVASQEGGQAAARRVDEAIRSPFADRRELREAETQYVGGNADRRAVKISAGDDLAGVGTHHRVVGGGGGFRAAREMRESE